MGYYLISILTWWRKGGKKNLEKKNHFINFAVELLFEILYSHLRSCFSKTTGADCRWILLQSQTVTSASGYMSLIFKDGQQQQDLCPGVTGQRASTYRLCYFHLSTQSRPPFHFRSFNINFCHLNLDIIKKFSPNEKKEKGTLNKKVSELLHTDKYLRIYPH